MLAFNPVSALPSIARTSVVVCMMIVAGSSAVYGQEFDCTVTLDYSQLSGSNFEFLQDLRIQVEEYVNDQVWTEDRYEPEERIDCSIEITMFEAITLTRFRGQVIVASRRPIYGTGQQTSILSIRDDDWVFDYAQGTPLVSDLDRFDPLTTLIDYYIHIMLGYDYDTFEEFGGTVHYERARRLADLGKNQSIAGWEALGGDRTRAQIVTEMLDPRFRALRETYYLYHLEGLDRFVADTDLARRNVMASLQKLKELSDAIGRSYTIDLFFSAKSKELAGVFEDSQLGGTAYDLLSDLDPSHMNDYNPLIQ